MYIMFLKFVKSRSQSYFTPELIYILVVVTLRRDAWQFDIPTYLL